MEAENLALHAIQDTLNLHGYDCARLDLPDPGVVTINTNNNDDYKEAQEEEQGRQMRDNLNREQSYVLETILQAIQHEHESAKCYFLHDSGGCGETYLYNTLIHLLRGSGKVVVAVAWTGIAATLLDGGRTVHSRFKLPMPALDTSSWYLSGHSIQAQQLANCNLIIWDEATMAPAHALSAIDPFLLADK